MRKKIGGSILALLGMAGLMGAIVLFVSAFDSSRLLYAGLKIFGTLELLPVSILMLRIGAEFCKDEAESGY